MPATVIRLRVAAGVTVIATVFIFGVLCVVLGGHDLLFAVTGAERVIGGTLLILGAANALGALRRTIGLADRLTLGCLLIGSLAGLLLGVAQAVNYGTKPDSSLLLWLGFLSSLLAAAEVALSGARLAIGSLLSRIGAATVLTTLVGLVPLVARSFTPEQAPATLDANVTVRSVGQRQDGIVGPLHLVEAEFKARNRTGRDVVILASIFNIDAANPSTRSMADGDDWEYPSELLNPNIRWSARYEACADFDVVETSYGLFPTGLVLESGQSTSKRVVSLIPVDVGNLVSAELWVGTAFADRLQLEYLTSEDNTEFTKKRPILHTYSMRPTSWVQALIRDDAELSVRYSMKDFDPCETEPDGDFEGLYGEVFTATKDDPRSDPADTSFRQRLASTYGIGFSWHQDMNVLDRSAAP